jgi:N-methylhydantoinase A
VDEVAPAFAPLTQAAMRALDADGVDPAARRFERAATLRYRGQSFELTVPLGRAGAANAPADLVAAFHAAHQARYGYALDREVELVTLRLRAVGKTAPVPLPRDPSDGGAPELGRVRLRLDGTDHDAPLLSRSRLLPGVTIRGPALVVEYSSTTLLPADAHAEVLASGVLSIILD